MKEQIRLFILFIKAITGNHNIYDGSTCEISARFWDVHDYHVSKGGTGSPDHFHAYMCSECKKKFFI